MHFFGSKKDCTKINFPLMKKNQILCENIKLERKIIINNWNTDIVYLLNLTFHCYKE